METAPTWPGEEINTEEDAFAAMKLARDRAKYRKSLMEKTESIYGPSKFDKTDYAKWRKDLMNQLTSILSANYAPLTYIVSPDNETVESKLKEKSFLACIFLQAPVEGEKLEADSRTVHLLIVEVTAGTKEEYILLSVRSFEFGRHDTKIFTKLFDGTVNNDCHKGVVESALKHPGYRSKHAIKYTMFV